MLLLLLNEVTMMLHLCCILSGLLHLIFTNCYIIALLLHLIQIFAKSTSQSYDTNALGHTFQKISDVVQSI